jgi:hypothetical protein
MSLRLRLERALGLGPSDDPRSLAVGAQRASTSERPLTSTAGARVRVVRDPADGAVGRLLVALHRRGVPFELREAGAADPAGVWVDGARTTPEDARARLVAGASGAESVRR